VTNASLEHDVDWFGTARARIGYAANGWLTYATGGYAFGRVELKGTATEVALGPNWSAKLEYLYVDLGTVNSTIVVPGAPSLTEQCAPADERGACGRQLSVLGSNELRFIT